MAKKIGRREFVKKSAKIGISAAVGSSFIHSLLDGSVHAGHNTVDIAVSTGADYMKSTARAVDLLGGIEKFVPKDSKVAILSNTQSRHPGSFTKPDIVRAVIRMCKKAGAKEINCLHLAQGTQTALCANGSSDPVDAIDSPRRLGSIDLRVQRLPQLDPRQARDYQTKSGTGVPAS